MKNSLNIHSLLIFLCLVNSANGYSQQHKPGIKEHPLAGRRQPLSEDLIKKWPYLDPWIDSVPGISILKLNEFRTVKAASMGKKVIVAIIDGGVDIDHEMFKNTVWTNQGEVPDNNIDDDKNGYVDDMHGWNFLGRIQHAQLELTRMVTAMSTRFETRSPDQVTGEDRPDYERWKTLDAEFKKQSARESQRYHDVVLTYDSVTASEQARKYILFLEDETKYRLNPEFDPKEITGDDPNNPNDKKYGDNNVTNVSLQDVHGTHVAGIIQSVIDEAGKAGLPVSVELMILRAVPNGDEYDKDIALAIRYAADNGAAIINMSLGKKYSPHKEWVWDAIAYAEKKNVLLVKAAGNDFSDLDRIQSFPSDTRTSGKEFADNIITVGSANPFLNENIISGFSNYGNHNVDLFAPGSQIFSSFPGNQYGFDQGTSMAAPFVTGVAALLKYKFPQLRASELKHILIESAVKYGGLAIVPGSRNHAARFSTLSVAGGLLNAYRAVQLAENITKH